MDIASTVVSHGRGVITLIYGVAGSGKTNLALHILKVIAESSPRSLKHYYISTEGSIFAHLIDRYGLARFDNIEFTEVVNLDHLLEAVLNIYVTESVGMVIIDSVNNHYRLEVLYNRNANTLLNLVMATLLSIAKASKYPALVTAQTTISELGDVKVSGESILKYWCDNVVRLEHINEKREACFEAPSNLRGLCIPFTIGEEGVKSGE